MYRTRYRVVGTLFGVAMAIAALLAGCVDNKKAGDENVRAIENSDSIPDAVKKMVRAVADDDSTAFADIVSYPLQRPYPLHNINNREEMKHYYKKLVDDSLKRVLTSSAPSRWQEFGWRGWSVNDGEYVWADDSVYNVPYVSAAELKEKHDLERQEIETLHSRLRKGWSPQGCFLEVGGAHVYRVDAGERKGATDYRMLVYNAPVKPQDLPSLEMHGTQESEGSEGSVYYHFTTPDGIEAILSPEPTDNMNPSIIFTTPDGKETEVNVETAYWLDLIRGVPASMGRTPAEIQTQPSGLNKAPVRPVKNTPAKKSDPDAVKAKTDSTASHAR